MMTDEHPQPKDREAERDAHAYEDAWYRALKAKADQRASATEDEPSEASAPSATDATDATEEPQVPSSNSS